MLKNSNSTRQTQAAEKAHLRKLIRERRSLRWYLERVNKQIRAQEERIQSVEQPRTGEVRKENREIKSFAEVSEKFEKLITFAESSIRENNRSGRSSE